jgi:hypothetical protein
MSKKDHSMYHRTLMALGLSESPFNFFYFFFYPLKFEEEEIGLLLVFFWD